MAAGVEMGKKQEPLSPVALAAHVGWIAILLGYFIWSVAMGRGLHGVLMRWQIESGGSYSDLPAIVAHLALAGPSIWLLFGHLEARGRAAARSPEDDRRLFLRGAWGLFGLAGMLLAVGIFCIVMAARAPGYVPPVEIGATQLARGDYPPDAPVKMFAQPVPGASYSYREIRGRMGSMETSWRGVRPLDGMPNRLAPLPPPSLPVMLFSEARAAARDGEEKLADVIQVSGRVVKNGLPALARRKLEEAGVTIAEPHFVLRDEEEGGGWLVGMGLSLFFAFAAGLIGTVMLLRGLGVIPAPGR